MNKDQMIVWPRQPGRNTLMATKKYLDLLGTIGHVEFRPSVLAQSVASVLRRPSPKSIKGN